ncbi:GNAT family N-acetyltransferase [Streptosporangium sp. KLBMP 9127]|nr:N-acetyltransferase [Streptosporangium sp. KLBMP 9127]
MALDPDEEFIEVADRREASRFEVSVDGDLAGFADYRLRPGKIVFTHAEIDPRFEGRGLGGRLVAAALDASRTAGLSVAPVCPFVASYIKRHPDYLDLVAPDYRDSVT